MEAWRFRKVSTTRFQIIGNTIETFVIIKVHSD